MGPSPCRDWSRISFKNAPRREGESLHSAKKMRGISAGKSSSNNKTNSSRAVAVAMAPVEEVLVLELELVVARQYPPRIQLRVEWEVVVETVVDYTECHHRPLTPDRI